MKTKFLPLLLAFTACTDSGSSSDFEQAASGMVGIYRIDSHTRNELACSPDGAAVEGTHEFAVGFMQKFFGIELLTFYSCASPADCRDKATNTTGFLIDFSFSVQFVGDGELTGGGGSSGFNRDGVCEEGEVWDTRLTLTGSSLRIQQGITVSDNYPADDGTCATDLAADAADGNECSKMEVLTATFVEEL
jgi:hypothetical protein